MKAVIPPYVIRNHIVIPLRVVPFGEAYREARAARRSRYSAAAAKGRARVMV